MFTDLGLSATSARRFSEMHDFERAELLLTVVRSVRGHEVAPANDGYPQPLGNRDVQAGFHKENFGLTTTPALKKP